MFSGLPLWGEPPQNWNLFIKTVYSYFTHLQSTLHLMQYTYWDVFFHCSKQFLNLSVSMPFSASGIFCFTSSTLAKCFPLRTFFILGNKKKLFGVRSDELGGWGTGGHAIFGQKLLNTQHSVGRCAGKSPIMKWANALSLQKKFTEAEHSLSQQCQLVHWYRWLPRTLT